MVYHPELAALVMVDGVAGDGETLLNDTWHYQAVTWPAVGEVVAMTGLIYHTVVTKRWGIACCRLPMG
jgi:hypothetical protein